VSGEAPNFRAAADPNVYRPDLDGLRAVAVGLVIVSHAHWPWPNNGGDVGVTAFFVLSGYLITTILVAQQERTGRIDLVAFYRRRIARLAPALLGLLAFTVVVGVAIGLTSEWQLGLISCLGYISNWVQVAGINIDPLGHTWSLAIEEQFYLVWPLALILLRGRMVAVALVGILAASVLRLVATGDFEYFSTFTRADAILLGCVVAVARPRVPAMAAVLGVAMMVAVTLIDPVHDIAIPATMIATVAVIAGRFEALGVLAPIGLRAYSLYLWNYPMYLLFGAIGAVAPLMTFLVGEISYRLLEARWIHRGGRRSVTTVAPASERVIPAETPA
jgi:peptidoglycan/LPS O-acetylase OafA/YrhL